MIQAVIISVGLFDPEAILSDITVVGIIVTEEVLITKNVIILREAISLLLFNSFNLVIAFIPKGVAALPSPSIFITIFDDIYAIVGSPLGISGNTTLIILDNLLDIIFSIYTRNCALNSKFGNSYFTSKKSDEISFRVVYCDGVNRINYIYSFST